jgi:hypothetical protein
MWESSSAGHETGEGIGRSRLRSCSTRSDTTLRPRTSVAPTSASGGSALRDQKRQRRIIIVPCGTRSFVTF